MKRNVLLIPFVAVMTLMVVAFASAGLASDIDTDFNGVDLTSSNTMVGDVDDVVPVRVTFTADVDAADVKVKVYMEGHRDDVSVKTDRFDIEAGSSYTKLLALKLPTDSDDLSEKYTLYVEIVSKDDQSEARYTISMQRESYTFEVKSVDLKIPSSAASGVYEMEVLVYNDDAETTVKQLVSIGGSASTTVLAAVKNQNLMSGETVTYDLVIVNSADDIKVFTLNSVSGDALSVSVPSVVTVGPKASQIVPVAVTADKDAEVGTYTFSVDVDGEQTVFGANVVGGSVSSSVIALTVILVIVFVVLLAVLVVLLTKKEKPIEEVETSYY